MQFGMSCFTGDDGVEFLPALHRGFDCLRSHPIPAAQTAPPAMSVMPAMNRIVSARVSNQLLRMLRLNRWTAPREGGTDSLTTG